MDASIVLWQQWLAQAQVKDLLPELHGHQKKTLALFVLGITLSGCAVLQRVAEKVSLQGISPVKMTSIERRLARFIANERVVVTKIWNTFLRQVLPFWQGNPMQFVLDATPFRDDATIVSSSIAGAFTGFACCMGGDASEREMGRETMEHCGAFA